MPQVVVVLGSLAADERDALADRATAVGALVMYVDPALDDEMQDLVERAARVAIERSLSASNRAARPPSVTEPPSAGVDIEAVTGRPARASTRHRRDARRRRRRLEVVTRQR